MQTKILTVDTVFESDTVYIADRKQYDFYPSENYEEIHCWWTFLNSGNIPLRAIPPQPMIPILNFLSIILFPFRL